MYGIYLKVLGPIPNNSLLNVLHFYLKTQCTYENCLSFWRRINDTSHINTNWDYFCLYFLDIENASNISVIRWWLLYYLVPNQERLFAITYNSEMLTQSAFIFSSRRCQSWYQIRGPLKLNSSSPHDCIANVANKVL